MLVPVLVSRWHSSVRVSPMMCGVLRAVVFVCCLALALATDPGCVIELECAECVPDNLPLVTSHRARAGRVQAAEGEEVVLACRGGKFLQYPLLATVAAVCEGGRYRVRHDQALRHLLELGCQENLFEDVLHEVEWCGSPLQGRAYQVQEPTSRATRHLATLCFDADRGVAVRAHACNAPRLAMRAHSDRAAPLTLLGNFNHMFDARTRGDAERLYGDDARMNRRLQELLKHERHAFADQTLTSGKLLSGDYFEDQDARVTDFVSNKVAVWRSVAAGNLHHVQHDVAELLRAARGAGGAELHVYSGTHGVAALRSGRAPLYLKPGGRFPVPRYVWTVVVERARGRGVALVLLNDPFVAVGEIRDSLFCESSCSKLQWARALRRHLNYETPLYGLVFCCEVHQFADVVTEMPKDVIKDVPRGDNGLLTQL